VVWPDQQKETDSGSKGCVAGRIVEDVPKVRQERIHPTAGGYAWCVGCETKAALAVLKSERLRGEIGKKLGVKLEYSTGEYRPSDAGPFGHRQYGGKRGQNVPPGLRVVKE